MTTMLVILPTGQVVRLCASVTERGAAFSYFVAELNDRMPTARDLEARDRYLGAEGFVEFITGRFNPDASVSALLDSIS